MNTGHTQRPSRQQLGMLLVVDATFVKLLET